MIGDGLDVADLAQEDVRAFVDADLWGAAIALLSATIFGVELIQSRGRVAS
jgi:hypothetical protein